MTYPQDECFLNNCRNSIPKVYKNQVPKQTCIYAFIIALTLTRKTMFKKQTLREILVSSKPTRNRFLGNGKYESLRQSKRVQNHEWQTRSQKTQSTTHLTGIPLRAIASSHARRKSKCTARPCTGTIRIRVAPALVPNQQVFHSDVPSRPTGACSRGIMNLTVHDRAHAVHNITEHHGRNPINIYPPTVLQKLSAESQLWPLKTVINVCITLNSEW